MEVKNISAKEFDRDWRTHYEAVFVDRDIDKRPFRHPGWKMACIGSPAFYFDTNVNQKKTPRQIEHEEIYVALEKSILAMGDTQVAGFLRGGPHPLHSGSLGLPPFSRAMYRMRFDAVEGFDLHLFGVSESWGAVISWEEYVAIVGGDANFMEMFERSAGGRMAIRKHFEGAVAYLPKVGQEQREFADRLRASCFPD